MNHPSDGLTPSQTVGPYLSIGLPWSDGPYVIGEGDPGGVWLTGVIRDGTGAVVPDALVETWQADPDGLFAHPDDPRGAPTTFRGFGRCPTGDDGGWAILTRKPGRAPAPGGGWQAPHVDVSVFARGLLDRVVTRLYFADEAEANAADPVLLSVPVDRRDTLLAWPTGTGYRFDIRLRGSMKPSSSPSEVLIRLHHEVGGAVDGSPILLINSLGADLSMWRPQLGALGERHRLIRYDARGHGRSAVPAGPYTIEDLGRDALAVLDALGVARAHVVGLSLGGMTAMWLAAHAPDRVDRLVLCCTSARLGPPHQWAERARLVRAHGTTAVADAVVSRWLTPEYAAEHPDDVAALRTMIAGTPAEGYAGACAAIQTMDQRAYLPGIVAPTLVVAGAEDPATPPAHAELIAAAVPGATLAVVSDAAHLATWQHPEVINPLILEALDGR